MPSMSPRTQQMQMAAGAGADQADQMFEKGFSDMAYSVMLARFPDLVQDIVTFKVLDTDVDNGMGVGAFVLMRKGQALYVPVILSDNNLKPIEIVYHKALNIFLPLTKAWLAEIDRTALGALGEGIKTPETLYTDVDMRNVVVPPITGRFSYAAYVENPRAYDRAEAVALIEKTASEPRKVLLEFLSDAPNVVKQAMVRVLEKNPRLLKHAAQAYGVNALTDALRLRQVKTAAKQHFGGALWIADSDTTPTEFKRIFGDRAAEAYVGVRRKGYAAKDERFQHNLAMQEQPYARWVEPQQPGVYTLVDAEGREKPAFVMPNPVDIMAKGSRYGRRPVVPAHNPAINNSYYDPNAFGGSVRYYPEGRPNEGDFADRRTTPLYLAVFSDGSYLETPRLAGRDDVADAVAGQLHKRMFVDLSGEPRKGVGVWIRQRGTTFQATAPVEIQSIMTDSSGTRRIKVTSPGGMAEKTVVTEARNPYNTIWMPEGANIVYLPPDFVWIPLAKKQRRGDFFTSIEDLAGYFSSTLQSSGVRKTSIKNAGANQFSIEGGPALGKIAALKKLAYDFELKVEDAEALLEKAAEARKVSFWLATPAQLAQAQMRLEKRAQDPGMDPAAMQQDPNAAAAPPAPPPPPTPTDLAAMEMDQQIQMEMQKLQEKQQMLAALTQRANEIAGGAPPSATAQAQAMGAPPPSMNMATGAPGPGMGAPPPGMDQGMSPDMGQGMDQPAPPPMAMMGQDGLSASAMEQQVNPQFLEQAAQLQSDDVFDAAALASLAQSPILKDLVSQYMPNLEKALDNLGRTLLTLYMQEPELKQELGESSFRDLEDNLRATTKSMGDLVLRLNQNAHVIKGQFEHETA